MNYPSSIINIGDKLIRPKIPAFLDHFGVVIAPNTVLQNTPERGEHAVTIKEFSNGQSITVSRTGADPIVVEARSQRILRNPKRYHLLFRNCQHTASETLTGIANSPYVAIAFFILFGLFVYFFLRRR